MAAVVAPSALALTARSMCTVAVNQCSGNSRGYFAPRVFGAQLGNGAKELLDEVATGKVTGEEEIWSHTDLWDFQANVDGARIAFEALQPALDTKNPALAATLTERFSALQTLLDQYRDGDGFVLYTDLTDEQVKELAAAVNALSEPLAELTAAVVL